MTFGSLVQAGLTKTPFTNTNDVTGQSGSVFLNSEVEPYVAVDPNNPKHIVGAWQQDRWTNGGARGIVVGVSTDGGNTWTDASIPGATVNSGGTVLRMSDPWVSFGPDSRVYVSWLGVPDPNVANPTGLFISSSADGGTTWSTPTAAITNNGDTNLFDDKDSLTADPYTAGEAYVVWDRLNFSQNIGPAMFSHTTDGGQTWSTPVQIFNPTNGQTISNQIVVLPGDVLVDLAVDIDYATNATSIVVMRSTDHGATWSAPITVNTINDTGVTDPNNGTGVRAGDIIPMIAVDPADGHVYVVWQDNRFSSGTHSDVALSESTDGGLTWSTPIKANQTPTNIPTADQQAFTPSVAVEANGLVAVSYYDFRNNTGTGGALTDRWISFANPAQSNFTFGNEQRLTDTSFNMELAPNAEGEFLGDYEALVAGGNTSNSFSSFFAEAVSTSTPSVIFYRGTIPPNTLSLTNSSPPTGVVEGQSAGRTLATFSDASPDPNIKTYTAVVTWGDGTTDTLTSTNGGIASNGGGSFSVVDSHTYAEESAGESFSVQITDNGGGSAGSSGTVAVADAPLGAGSLTPPVAVEGQAFTNSTVFHFSDSDPAGAASDYSALVTLGDGNTVTLTSTSSANGQIVARAGGFDVQLSYTYGEELSGKTFSLAVTDAGGATTSGSTSTFGVTDASLTPSPVTFNAKEGVAVTGVTVATFTDADPAGQASDYTATVNWSDGDTTASVSIVPDGHVAGQFDVVASKSHAYAEGGNYAVTVSIADAGGATATAHSTAAVADLPITVTGMTFSATEGSAVTHAVVTFTDADLTELVGSYTATINWGDGNSSTGTVLKSGTGKFRVRGTHTYAEAGPYSATVTVSDTGGASAQASSTINVSDAKLSGLAVAVNAFKSRLFSGQVATFTDANPTAPLGDFSATITWGDASSSTGTVSTNPSGGFQVQGGHTYTRTGTFTFKVTISDKDGAKLTVRGTATVTIGTASAVAGGPTPIALAPVNGAVSPNQSSTNQSTAVIQGAAVSGSTTAAVGGQSVAPALDNNASLLDPTQTAAIADRAFVSISDENDDGTGWFSLG